MDIRDLRRAMERETRRRVRYSVREEQSRPSGPGWVGTAIIAAVTAGAGAVAALLLDPARGRARRARLLDQGSATVRRAGRRIGPSIGAARASVSNAIHAIVGRSGDGQALDDASLAAKLESQLFRDPVVPKGSININVEQGIAVLRGEVPDAEMRDRLANEAASVKGVWSVHNLLHLPGEPVDDVPVGVLS